MRIVAFDPGKNIGFAVIDEAGNLHEHGLYELHEIASLELADSVVVVGSGTGSRALIAVLRGLGIDPVVVDERETSLEGRRLYFRDHPPAGIARIVPIGMRMPPRPIDDYAAYAIGLRYLALYARSAQDASPGG